MILTLIAAVGLDGAIGRQGQLAFHLRPDMIHFKELTMGSPVIMGRKTFESLPKGALPGRRNIVVSRREGYTAAGAETAGSLDAALSLAADAPQAFIIGGAEIYRSTIDRADLLEITFIDARCPDADTFFPEINPARWEMTAETPSARDAASGIAYRFATFQKRS